MKEVEFYSSESNNINEVAKKIFIDMGRHDPASIYYNRILERPKINWLNVILQITIPNVVFMLTIITLLKKGAKLFAIVISCIVFCSYIILNLKKVFICAILIYQHYAPASIRMKCRFEPSCSQYMILAIEKYGLFKGVKIGLNRLSRCKVGNGGYDLP